MTEPEALPPQDPAQIPAIEQMAEHEPWPFEPPTSEIQAAIPPPPPALLSAPQPVPQAAPVPPPYSPSPKPSPAAPLPPPFSPPPRTPEPVPYEPEPPTAPPTPPYVPPVGGVTPTPGAMPPSNGSGWATAAHLTSLAGLGFSCLLIGLVGPLIVWLAKKDDDPEADWHGKESLNFQINMLILWVVAWPLYCLCCLGMVIHLLQPIYIIVMVLIASIKAANGKRWQYPFTMRLLND